MSLERFKVMIEVDTESTEAHAKMEIVVVSSRSRSDIEEMRSLFLRQTSPMV